MSFWRGVMSLFNKKSISPSLPLKKDFGVESAVSAKMEQNINLWWKMFTDDAPWQNENVRPLGLPVAICREIVRPALSEYEVTIKGSVRADYLNERLQASFMEHIRWNLEQGIALGGIAFKPYISGGQLWVDATNAGTFTPTRFDESGRAVAGVFREHIKHNDRWYIRLEYHDLQGTDYTIQNKAYESDSEGTVRNQVSLAVVPEWALLTPNGQYGNIKRPLFAYFQMPASNNIDPTSNIGISIYGGATAELIKQADEQWDGIVWEYKSGERKVFVDDTAVNMGRYSEDRLYGFTPLMGDKDPFHEFSPDFRADSLYTGFQNILKLIEFNVGLSFGTISDPQSVEKSATEIRASRQRMYQLIEDILKELDYTVDGLVYAMDTYASLFKTAPAGAYKLDIQHGDSVLQTEDDWQRDVDSMRLDVSAGLVRPELYLSKKYKVDETDALKMMPEMAELVKETVVE